MSTRTLMNTISGTFERCKEENIGISMNHLRYLCKSNIIPTCRIGNKYLINWDILMDYLNGKYREEQKEIVQSEPKVDTSLSSGKAKVHKIRKVV